MLLFWYYSRINQKVKEYARDRSKRPRFYAALFVSFTWEKVKTHVIRLRVIEGANTHDQIAFSCIPFILSESSKECCPWVRHAAHASKQLEDYADCERPHFGPLRSPAIIWFDFNQKPIPTKSLSPFWRISKTRTEINSPSSNGWRLSSVMIKWLLPLLSQQHIRTIFRMLWLLVIHSSNF